MNNMTSYFIFGLLLVTMQCKSVLSLWCAQCRPSAPGCRSGHIPATQCPEEATACFTYNLYLINNHGQGTYRGCTKVAAPGCRDVTVSGEAALGCTEVCDWNNCNTSYNTRNIVVSRRGSDSKTPNSVLELLAKASP